MAGPSGCRAQPSLHGDPVPWSSPRLQHCCAASLAETCPSQETDGHPGMGWQGLQESGSLSQPCPLESQL